MRGLGDRPPRAAKEQAALDTNLSDVPMAALRTAMGITAEPLHTGCGGLVKIASLTRYSQLPANTRRLTTLTGSTICVSDISVGIQWRLYFSKSFPVMTASTPGIAMALEISMFLIVACA